MHPTAGSAPLSARIPDPDHPVGLVGGAFAAASNSSRDGTHQSRSPKNSRVVTRHHLTSRPFLNKRRLLARVRSDLPRSHSVSTALRSLGIYRSSLPRYLPLFAPYGIYRPGIYRPRYLPHWYLPHTRYLPHWLSTTHSVSTAMVIYHSSLRAFWYIYQ
jgi:hypothetical protein